MASEDAHRQSIIARQAARDRSVESVKENNAALASAVRAAKDDAVQHNIIAEWMEITKDGLTKFLKRHPDRED